MKLLSKVRDFIASLGGEHLAARLFRAGSGAFVVKVFGAGLGFATEVVLARLMNVDQYGIYVYVWTWVSVLALPATFGFKGALVRFISEFRTQQRWRHLKGVLQYSTRFVTGGSLLIGGIVATGAYLLIPWQGREELNLGLAFGMIALPLLSLNIVRRSALQGLKRVVYADIPYLLIRRLLIICIALLSVYWTDYFSAYKTISLISGVLLFTFLAYTFLLKKFLPNKAKKSEPLYEKKKWLKTALPFLLISGAAIVQNKTDVIMVGLISGSKDAGIYGAASRVTKLITFGLTASNMIVAPIVSELYTSKKIDRLQKVIAISSSGVFLYTVLASVALTVAGGTVLSLFGSEFTNGYAAMVLLTLAAATNAVAGPVGHLATMTGHQWTASKAFGVGALINIVLNVLLIPRFGMVGAAFATIVSNITWNVVLSLFAWRKIGINSTAFSIFKI